MVFMKRGPRRKSEIKLLMLLYDTHLGSASLLVHKEDIVQKMEKSVNCCGESVDGYFFETSLDLAV